MERDYCVIQYKGKNMGLCKPKIALEIIQPITQAIYLTPFAHPLPPLCLLLATP